MAGEKLELVCFCMPFISLAAAYVTISIVEGLFCSLSLEAELAVWIAAMISGIIAGIVLIGRPKGLGKETPEGRQKDGERE